MTPTLMRSLAPITLLLATALEGLASSPLAAPSAPATAALFTMKSLRLNESWLCGMKNLSQADLKRPVYLKWSGEVRATALYSPAYRSVYANKAPSDTGAAGSTPAAQPVLRLPRRRRQVFAD